MQTYSRSLLLQAQDVIAILDRKGVALRIVSDDLIQLQLSSQASCSVLSKTVGRRVYSLPPTTILRDSSHVVRL